KGNDVHSYRAPENRAKLGFGGLVPQELLRKKGTGPPPCNGEHMQSALPRAPCTTLGRRFVEGIGQKGDSAGHKIDKCEPGRKPPKKVGHHVHDKKGWNREPCRCAPLGWRVVPGSGARPRRSNDLHLVSTLPSLR